MIFTTTLLAALAMMTVAYVLRKAALAFAAAGLWIVFAVYVYGISATPSGGAWDIYYALFFLAIGMVLLCSLEPAIMRPKKEDLKEDIQLSDIDQTEKDWDDLHRQTRIPRIGRRAYQSRRSRSKEE